MRRPERVLCAAALALAGCTADRAADSVDDVGGAHDAAGGDTTAPDAAPHVPPVTLRRLNRAEYNNSVRDLLGTTLRPADGFPADDVSGGFDTIGSVLTVSPLHVELYATAAREAVADVLERRAVPETSSELAFDAAATTGIVSADAGYLGIYSPGTVRWTFHATHAANHRIELSLSADQAGDDDPVVVTAVDGVEIARDTVSVDRGAAQIVRYETWLDAGPRSIEVRYENDLYDEATGADRNLLLGDARVVGPLGVVAPPHPDRARLLPCNTDAPLDIEGQRACAAQAIAAFLPRAWRRDVSPVEVDRALALGRRVIDAGDGVELAVSLMFEAALLSPSFIFRIERQAEGDAPGLLDPFALATRLSYFLWSSTPDETLLAAARDGSLNTPAEIERQVRRMAADPRAAAFVDDFAGQWLMIRALDAARPDPTVFPGFDDALRASMRAEMKNFFAAFLAENRPFTELLTASDTWVDARMAAHYGLAGDFPADAAVRVSFGDGRRGGLLGQAGILTVTSNPGRTSPVRRGKFILSQLLCSEPPAPPPGVEGLSDTPVEGLSLREQMEAHRADPDCRSCHVVMDPLGFGLENYDAIGRWRDSYGVDPIDATGTLPDGRTFHGAASMGAMLAEDPLFAECVAEKLLTYGLGRLTDWDDYAAITTLGARFAADGYGLVDALVAVAQSPQFRMVAPRGTL